MQKSAEKRKEMKPQINTDGRRFFSLLNFVSFFDGEQKDFKMRGKVKVGFSIFNS